jgi:hypothetical protein
MLRTVSAAAPRAARAFATSKAKSILSDAMLTRTAVGGNSSSLTIAQSFVSAFAPLLQGSGAGVRVANVSVLPEVTAHPLVRDMKQDIAFRYTVGGALSSSLLQVVPQPRGRALLNLPASYLPGRALAHASGHYLAAVEEEATVVVAQMQTARKEAAAAAEAAEAAEAAAAEAEEAEIKGRAPKSKARVRRPSSKVSKAAHDGSVYKAYARVEPVHVLVLSDSCPAFDSADKAWRTPKSSPLHFRSSGKYGWASPLFSTFRLTTDAGSVRLGAGGAKEEEEDSDPGPDTFASSLRERLSITIVHLPMVPAALNDEAAWGKVATLPEHKAALESAELRQWLNYLANSELENGGIRVPQEAARHPVLAQSFFEVRDYQWRMSPYCYTEKEVASFSFQAERKKTDFFHEVVGKFEKDHAGMREEVETERAALWAEAERERAALWAEVEKERAALWAEVERERGERTAAPAVPEEEGARAAAAAALVQERAAAAAALEKEQEARASVRNQVRAAAAATLKKRFDAETTEVAALRAKVALMKKDPFYYSDSDDDSD